MASTPPFAYVNGRLLLQVGDQTTELGSVSIPVRVNFLSHGNLSLTAETAQVRDLVETAFSQQATEEN